MAALPLGTRPFPQEDTPSLRSSLPGGLSQGEPATLSPGEMICKMPLHHLHLLACGGAVSRDADKVQSPRVLALQSSAGLLPTELRTNASF